MSCGLCLLICSQHVIVNVALTSMLYFNEHSRKFILLSLVTRGVECCVKTNHSVIALVTVAAFWQYCSYCSRILSVLEIVLSVNAKSIIFCHKQGMNRMFKLKQGPVLSVQQCPVSMAQVFSQQAILPTKLQ